MKLIRSPKMAFSLLLAVIAVSLLIFINEVSFRRSSGALANIEDAQNTGTALNNLMETLLDAETGQRGYLLTGDMRYLSPYTSAIETVNQQLDALRTIFSTSPAPLAEFGVMSRHISRKLAELDLSVRMRREGKEDAWRFVLTTDVGKDQMTAIRSQSDKLAELTQGAMAKGHEQMKQTLLLSRIGVAILAVLGLLAFYMYLLQSNALLVSGQREKASLQRERDQLDSLVRERTARLAELATHLQNVREDERAHLARELHDELGALLTAAKLDVARVKSRLSPEQPEAAERLIHLTSTLNEGIALKRRIVEDLRPSSLSHLGLVASLEILAREFAERSGLAISTDLETVDLGGSAQLTVYRLIQESLTNIGKYAEAKNVFIGLSKMDGYVTVEVKDDGKGFEVGDVKPSSHGISGMRHRVEAAGGKLIVASTPGKGAKITAALPAERAAPAESLAG